MRITIYTMLFSAVLAASAVGQVSLKKKAVVYIGSAANTSAPATVVAKKVRAATPEWRKIVGSGIDPNSARGKQLITKMNERIRNAVQSVAGAENRDMVTRKKDMRDARGRDVVDITDLVIDELAL